MHKSHSPFDRKSQGTVRRDHQWVEREYGREKWPAVLAETRRLLDAGETRIGAIVRHLTHWEYGDELDTSTEIIIDGRRVFVPILSALAGFYGLISSSVIRTCRNDTRAVLDLGAGWGRSLFLAWSEGAPPNAQYGCLEFTEAGRECASLIASIVPAMRLRSSNFDLYNPDLTEWRSLSDHVVLLSVYGVEQAPKINSNFFDQILDVAPAVDVIHFEPVGWQCRKDSGHLDYVGSSADYAAANDTNVNLWPMLRKLEAAGRIAIVRVAPDTYGLNPRNAATLIHWRKLG